MSWILLLLLIDLFLQAVKQWADYDPGIRYEELTYILSIPELCCLLNEHPSVASSLTLHPQSSLSEHKDSCFDNAWIQEKTEPVQVSY